MDWGLTRWPADGGRSDRWLVLPDLEPNGAIPFEVSGGLSGWNLSHVEHQRAGVADRCIDTESNCRAGCNVGCGSDGSGGILVASQVVRVDIGDRSVAVLVGGHLDILPISGGLAVENESWEGICWVAER